MLRNTATAVLVLTVSALLSGLPATAASVPAADILPCTPGLTDLSPAGLSCPMGAHETSCLNLGLTCADSDTSTFGGYSCLSYPIGVPDADAACWANRDDFGRLQGYVLGFQTTGTAHVPTGALFVQLIVCFGSQDVGTCDHVSVPSHTMTEWAWSADGSYCEHASAEAVWTLGGMSSGEVKSEAPGPFIGSSC